MSYLIYARWSWQKPVNSVAWRTNALGVCGIVLAVASTLIVSPWLGYLGFVLTVMAWLSTVSDSGTGRSLAYLAWPLLIVWQPPYSDLATADTYLITYLQQLSGRMSSRLLDLIGLSHFHFGKFIELVDRSFSVEQGCSGCNRFLPSFASRR